MLIKAVLFLYFMTCTGFIGYLFTRNKQLVIASRILFIMTVTAHLIFTIALSLEMHHLPVSSPPQALNMMVLLSSIVFTFLIWKKPTTVLAAFFLPIATFSLVFIAPSVGHNPGLFTDSSKYWYPLHTLSVISGEAFLIVAFITSVVYLIHDKVIKKGAIHNAASSLPPLAVLDRILYICLSSGFIAITIGMILGALWASSLDLDYTGIAPKILSGMLTWLVFAFSVHQRFAIGWRGRRTAVITIIGFLVMIIGFILINLVYPHAHGIGLLP
ncbi:MAG TPA: cytochrome c biogenesis protein CcsA [Deltaproteobacteria bacterium]|nr:cytochrome c biogenesis protein CcsA [Deltaproteobacteria bacterium]